VKPKFAEGQRVRVVRAPEWDASCEGALGTVEEYSGANRAGTGWELAVRLEIGGGDEGWELDEACLEAIPPVLPIASAEDTCCAADGSRSDETYAYLVLREGPVAPGLEAAAVATLGAIFGGRCVFSRTEVRTDTLWSIFLLWCGARPMGELVEGLRRAAPGAWEVTDDGGWRVWLDLEEDPALGALLGDDVLALHVDCMPWSSPRRRTERYGPEPS
jgi:hypothetical protein